MNEEQLRHIATDGPPSVHQRAVLFILATLAENDGSVSIDNQTLLSLIDITSKNLALTLSELHKRGWIERFTPGLYRVDPTVGTVAHGRLGPAVERYRDT
jgi:predicted transcriptional regulator of viral defense system